MNERKKGLPVISLLLAGVGFIFISSAPMYEDAQRGFGIFITLIALVCAIISLFRKKYKKLCAVIGIIICVCSFISFYNISNKREEMIEEQLERARTTYVITFDSDGGTYVEPMTVNKDTLLVEPTAPTKDGYVFGGWNYNGEKFTFNRYVNNYITGDVTLKAIWLKEQTSNITDNGHDFNMNSSSNSGNNSSSSGNSSGSSSSSGGNNSSTTNTSGRGYQQIYDEYAKKLKDAGPTSSVSEMAEICNDGVYEMARYMHSAKGIDGQYGTYEDWAGKLIDVYMKEVR